MLTRQKYAKNLKIVIGLFVAATVIFLLANFVLAAAGPDLGLNYAAGTGLSAANDPRVIAAKIIRIVLGFLGIIAVGLIIYAGWLWMTSEGSEDKVEQAKKILQNAVIGLIIILSAFAIVSFILNKLIGATTGGPGNGPGGPGNGPGGGISALGNGIIESHYPARGQKDVPRNASIIINFREPIKASTACKTTADKCTGDNINTDVVRIFQYSKEEEANCTKAYLSNPAKCVSLVKEAKVYSAVDGKTYVFDPIDNLGSPNGNIEYSVYLSAGLLRQSGEKAFPGFEKDYIWSFEVSNEIDLTPPQVKRGEVVPAPDNREDTTEPGVGKPAEGSITVNSRPSINQDARAASVIEQGDSPAASAEVNKNCQRDGNFSLAIKDGPIASLYTVDAQGNTINLGQGTFGLKGSNKQVIFSECNLILTLLSAVDNFAVGNLWNLTLNKATAADTITAGGTTYVASSSESGANFKVGPTDADTAESLVNVLANNPDVTASSTGKVIKLTAKIAGLAGDSIILSSSNSAALEVIAMADGSDKEDQITKRDAEDQPMNSAIQIVFNEAIMPLTVSGTSAEVENFIRVVNADAAAKPKDGACIADIECKSYRCADNKCVGNSLAGKFAVSNQYKTVDFLSDKECGFNTCGEKIYCLPPNSHLKVELSAANLISCANDNDCQANSPFNICDPDRKFCRDRDNEKNYYPQANIDITKPNIIDGITDAAFNSLDGNRDGAAYGPASFYNENTPEDISGGDNYEWSFFISDKLDLTPPKIITTSPIINGSSVDAIEAINISFNKLMLSSRLTSGSLIIQNGKDRITHYLLNLYSFVDQPLGFWVTNQGRQSAAGGVIDQTDVYINHTPFSGASSYKAQAGSGLKDIYQNCFLPCSSLDNPGNPSCCNGAPYAGESCP